MWCKSSNQSGVETVVKIKNVDVTLKGYFDSIYSKIGATGWINIPLMTLC